MTFWHRQALNGLFIGCLIFSLAACAFGNAPAHVPPKASETVSAQPTPTRLPSGTLLYQADWLHGLSGWQGTQGWKVVQGQLEADANGPATITIPYKPQVTDYAIEVRIQVVRLLRPLGGYFTLFASNQPGKDGYQAGVNNLEGATSRPNGAHPQAQVFIDPISSMPLTSFRPVDYEPGFKLHTYRVEIQENQVSYFIDGTLIATVSSTQTSSLSNAPIGLGCSLVVLRVSSFRIIAL